MASRGLRLFTLLVITLLASTAFAQNARLAGLVSDSTKAAIAGSSVELVNQQTHASITTQTNESGLYTVPQLQPGTYRITFSAAGFEAQVVNDAEVSVAGKITLNVVLHPGGVSESVVVDAAGLQINATDATVSTVIDSKFVANIPLNGRSFQSLLTAVPGVSVVPSLGTGRSGEFTVNGQRTEGNYFIVDGVAANTGASAQSIGYGGGFSGTTPNETVLGTTQGLLSVDALQEFRATTSSFSAENGRTPGGQFSIVSRSGTNQLHGTAYDYLRNAIPSISSMGFRVLPNTRTTSEGLSVVLYGSLISTPDAIAPSSFSLTRGCDCRRPLPQHLPEFQPWRFVRTLG